MRDTSWFSMRSVQIGASTLAQRARVYPSRSASSALVAVWIAPLFLSRIHLPTPLRSTPITALPRYYEGSDFPRVSSHRGISPIHNTQTSDRSVSNHPRGHLGRFLITLFPSAPGLSLRTVSRLRPPGLGLHLSLAGSPTLEGRIEFLSYGPVVHLQLLSTPHRCDAVSFGCP